jgi:hypothetical protein
VDAVMAALDGISKAGVAIRAQSADLTERNLRIILNAPELYAAAPEFTKNYREPDGGSGVDNPLISAGLEIRNSETGGGAFSVAPRFEVQVCRNGMTRTKEAVRKVHVGSQLDAGVVQWSIETQAKNLDLIRSQTTDAVRTFLSRDYLEATIAELEHKGTKLLAQPQAAVENICNAMSYTKEEQAAILDFFIKGGQPTTGGVVQAVTAYAAQLDDPDRAAELEGQAFEVLDRAFAIAA